MEKYITVPKLRMLCTKKDGSNPSQQYIHQCIKGGKLKPLAQVGRAYIFSEGEVKTFREKYFG
jgi:hypothetical protein